MLTSGQDDFHSQYSTRSSRQAWQVVYAWVTNTATSVVLPYRPIHVNFVPQPSSTSAITKAGAMPFDHGVGAAEKEERAELVTTKEEGSSWLAVAVVGTGVTIEETVSGVVSVDGTIIGC